MTVAFTITAREILIIIAFIGAIIVINGMVRMDKIQAMRNLERERVRLAILREHRECQKKELAEQEKEMQEMLDIIERNKTKDELEALEESGNLSEYLRNRGGDK